MMRLGILFWLLLVLGTGFTTFKVKYAVQDIEDQLNRVRKQTTAEQQEIRVLTAEWTYLTQPERLAELNRRFLGFAPIAAKQLQQRIQDIPLRPPPPAAAPPDELIAANPPVDQPAAIATAPEASLDALIAASLEPDQASVPAPAIQQSARPAVSPAVRAFTALALAPAAEAATTRPAKPMKASAAQSPGSLDALIAQIAEPRAGAR